MKRSLWAMLAVVLSAVLLLTGCGSTSGEISAKPSANTDKDSDIFKDEYITVSVSQLQEYINTSSSVWELAQRFFDDVIVYKDASGKYTYRKVDNSMPKSDYDWSKLVNVGSSSNKEFEYVENGKTISLKGIDVSRYQGDINWEKVAADGVEFAFIRVGYRGYSTGLLTVDEKFEENMVGALRSGVQVGVYFVTQAINEEEAAEEARFVLEKIAPYKVNWPVVIDLEEATGSNPRTAVLDAQSRTRVIKSFCDTIREGGYDPMLYCNIRWYMDEMDISQLAGYDKWLAQYFNRPFFPYEFTIWQYTNTGKVDGIEGNVDIDISMYNYGAWK